MRVADRLPEVIGDLTDVDDLRENAARDWVARSARGLEVFGYDQGLQVLEHPDLLKGPSFQYRLDQLGISGEARRYMDMGITNKEGDERRQMRASLAALFRPSQIARLRAAIRVVAESVLDSVADPTEWDLMELCWQIPARTYCELVSIPHSEAGTVIRIADSVLGTLLNVDTRRREEAEAAILESVDIVRMHLDARRGDLGDDFTSVMIRQQQDGLMTEEQLVAQSFALLQASVDNTAHQMGNTFGLLLTEPGRWRRLVEDRALRAAAIEEAVRLHPRFGTIFRLASKDVVIDDVVIPENAWAFVSTRAGQRDPRFFDEPDEFRWDRPAIRPLMFGAGPYNCLGQNLARMEIEEALDAVAERFPDLELTGGWQRRSTNAVSETTGLVVDLGVERSVSARVVPPARGAGAERDASDAGGPVLDCVVDAVVSESIDVVSLTLRSADGSDLPSWTAGAHVDLVLPGVGTRQYSLCGREADRTSYRVAVLHEPAGRGGSAYVHERIVAGDRVRLRGPRNTFALDAAPSYRFVAGGIGITAILPMVRAAQASGRPWTLIYLAGSADHHAFREELADLPADRVRLVGTRDEGRPPIHDVTGSYEPGRLLYACGPAGLLQSLASAGWPEDAVRVERFEPDSALLNAPRRPFRLTLARSGSTIEVPAELSALDALERAGIVWPYSCREGTCGSCEARVIAGMVDHRDAILTPAERRAHDTMMLCVSRGQTDEVVVEA